MGMEKENLYELSNDDLPTLARGLNNLDIDDEDKIDSIQDTMNEAITRLMEIEEIYNLHSNQENIEGLLEQELILENIAIEIQTELEQAIYAKDLKQECYESVETAQESGYGGA